MSQGKKHKKRRDHSGDGEVTSSAVKGGVTKHDASKTGPASKPDASSTTPGGKPKRRNERRWVGRDRIAEHRVAQRRRTVIYRSLVAVAILLVAGTVGWVVYRSQLPELPANYAVPAGATRAGVAVGKPDAPVTVDLYIDYQCPHCGDYEQATARYFEEQVEAGTVKVVYHPISILGDNSLRAAAAAGCATDQNATVRFTSEVFARGGEIDRETLIGVGKKIGLTSPKFAQCIQDGTYQDWALGVTRRADSEDVRGTPTVMVNGETVVARRSLETFVEDTKRAVADAAAAPRKSQPEQ